MIGACNKLQGSATISWIAGRTRHLSEGDDPAATAATSNPANWNSNLARGR
jgi:hypothetical protein